MVGVATTVVLVETFELILDKGYFWFLATAVEVVVVGVAFWFPGVDVVLLDAGEYDGCQGTGLDTKVAILKLFLRWNFLYFLDWNAWWGGVREVSYITMIMH